MVGLFFGPHELRSTDIFDLLGLDPTGRRYTMDEIRRAARHVATLLHPDRQIARPVLNAPYTAAQANAVLSWASGQDTGPLASTPTERLADLHQRAIVGHRSRWNPQGNQWNSPALLQPIPGSNDRTTGPSSSTAQTGRRNVIDLSGDAGSDSDDSVQCTGSTRRQTPHSGGYIPRRNWATDPSPGFTPRRTRTSAQTGPPRSPSPAEPVDTPSRPGPTGQRRSASPVERPSAASGARQRTPPASRTSGHTGRNGRTAPQSFSFEQPETPRSFGTGGSRRPAQHTPTGGRGQTSSSPGDSPFGSRPLPDPRTLSLRRLTVLAGDRSGFRVAVATIPARGAGLAGRRIVVTLGADSRGRVRYQLLSIDLAGAPVPGGAGQGNSITYEDMTAAGPVFLGRFRGANEAQLREFALALRANPDAGSSALPLANRSP